LLASLRRNEEIEESRIWLFHVELEAAIRFLGKREKLRVDNVCVPKVFLEKHSILCSLSSVLY
jgi:hypothetical protein